MTQPTCGTCRWKQANGECRRHPPIRGEVSVHAWLVDGTAVWGASPVWPHVNDTDWCGEHAPKEAPPERWNNETAAKFPALFSNRPPQGGPDDR
jgi:hypothetical protein